MSRSRTALASSPPITRQPVAKHLDWLHTTATAWDDRLARLKGAVEGR